MTQRARGFGGVVAAWAALAIVACGATTSRQPAPAPTQGGYEPMRNDEVPPSDPHKRIAYLAEQIATQRTKMQMPAPAPPVLTCTECTAAPMAETPQPTKTCPMAADERCHDTCTLADAICANAAEICKLASDLAGDKWADEKCETAKTTCSDASARCCGCHP